MATTQPSRRRAGPAWTGRLHSACARPGGGGTGAGAGRPGQHGGSHGRPGGAGPGHRRRAGRVRLPRRPQAGRRLGDLRTAGLTVAGRRCLDAGAAAGGFTDVLLRARRGRRGRGGRGVRAVGLAVAPRRPGDGPGADECPVAGAGGCSADRWTSPWPTCRSSRCARCCRRWPPARRPTATWLPMVKPQFEVARGRVGAGGVVRDPRRTRGGGAVRRRRRGGARVGRGRRGGEPAGRTGRQRGVLPVAATGHDARGCDARGCDARGHDVRATTPGAGPCMDEAAIHAVVVSGPTAVALPADATMNQTGGGAP